jgi:DNA-3-methyladenine glycosylase II
MKKAITHLRKADPVMAGIIERVGQYKPTYYDPVFHSLARTIAYQQLNGKAASTIFGRLTAEAGNPLTPEAILKLRPAKMRKLGLSKQKTEYIRGLAKMTHAGELNFESLPTLEDSAVIEHLTRAKGIGVWSVHMFLIFALKRLDVLPTGDLGVRIAMKKAYGLEELPKPKEMEKIAESWKPYSSVAIWYLWRSLDGNASL